MLHAGNYSGNYKLDKSATRERPIMIRDAGDGPVIFSGSGNLMDVTHCKVHWFHGLTFHGVAGAIYNGPGDVGTIGLTVTRCRFEDCYAGVFTRSTACRDLYVADNVFLGTKGTWHRAEHKLEPYKAVWVAGQGVDVCFNNATNLWDGLSTLQSPPTDDFTRKLSAQDFYNNDVGQVGDDNEADYGQHNIRFFRNRLVDSHCGLSAQPFYGGPCYFVRNLQYNVTRGVVFKLELNPAGVLIYNNTSVSTGTIGDKVMAGLANQWSNVQVYNNLFLGLHGWTLYGGPLDPGISRLDHNGYTFADPIRWQTYDAEHRPKTLKDYKSFADLSRDTGFEEHAVTIAFKDLVDVPSPQSEAADTDAAKLDARLTTGSAAIDAGRQIPNVTDGFAGKAPDLGAYEFGQPVPHYGPRP